MRHFACVWGFVVVLEGGAVPRFGDELCDPNECPDEAPTPPSANCRIHHIKLLDPLCWWMQGSRRVEGSQREASTGALETWGTIASFVADHRMLVNLVLAA